MAQFYPSYPSANIDAFQSRSSCRLRQSEQYGLTKEYNPPGNPLVGMNIQLYCCPLSG